MPCVPFLALFFFGGILPRSFLFGCGSLSTLGDVLGFFLARFSAGSKVCPYRSCFPSSQRLNDRLTPNGSMEMTFALPLTNSSPVLRPLGTFLPRSP